MIKLPPLLSLNRRTTTKSKPEDNQSTYTHSHFSSQKEQNIKRYFTDSLIIKCSSISKLQSKKSLTSSNDLPSRVRLLLPYRSSRISAFLRFFAFDFIVVDRRCKRPELIVNPTVPLRHRRRSSHRQSSLHCRVESGGRCRNRAVPSQRRGSSGCSAAVFVFFLLWQATMRRLPRPIRPVLIGIARVRIGDGSGESKRVRER